MIQFKYLGSRIEIISRAAVANYPRRQEHLNLNSTFRLLFAMIFSIFLYVYKSWTLTVKNHRGEMGYYRIILGMTSVGHIPNNAVKTPTDKKQGCLKTS